MSRITYASAPKVPMKTVAAEFLAAKSACTRNKKKFHTEVSSFDACKVHTHAPTDIDMHVHICWGKKRGAGEIDIHSKNFF